jgi:putative flippase GtrA
MIKWKSEFGYFVRYACAGGLNAIVGLGSIFLLMHAGVNPLISNAIGYALGLVVAFFTARLFVFRSRAKSKNDAVRYLISFAISFSANLITLHFAISTFGIDKNIAQLLATAAYIATMYCLSRIFVFTQRR